MFSLNRTYQERLSILKLWLSQFVSLKKVSFPEKPLLPKFFYNEVIKEEELGRGFFVSTYKVRFKRDTVAKKEFTGSKWDETGKNNFERGKLLKSLNQPNVVNFKNVCYQPFYIMFKYMYHLPFPLLEQFLKLVDWMAS